MKSNPEETYEKHVYEINVIEYYKEIVQRIEQDLPEGGEKDHFKMMFEDACKGFQKSVNIMPEMFKSATKLE